MADPLHSQKPPLVTVAMPVFNAGKYLRLAVLSVVHQTFTDWELLIIDDGSTDNALQDIVDITDPRIRILRDGSNRGLAARLNEAVSMAQGEYFARMDQDDISFPDRFQKQLHTLKNHPEVDLLGVRAIQIDETNRPVRLYPYALSHKTICVRPWVGFYLPHPVWMGRTDWFRRHPYKVPGPFFSEDQELLLRTHGNSQFSTMDEVLFGYRVKDKVNWRKLIRTRWTLLQLQIDYFGRSRHWWLAVLSILAFLARMLGDLVRWAGGPSAISGRSMVPDSVVLEWNHVLSVLNERQV